MRNSNIATIIPWAWSFNEQTINVKINSHHKALFITAWVYGLLIGWGKLIESNYIQTICKLWKEINAKKYASVAQLSESYGKSKKTKLL